MNAWLYILECSDGSLYVGSTTNLERRFAEHRMGEGGVYTRGRRPLTLVYAEPFARIDDAFAREKQVQGWSRRKRLALIAGNLADLKRPSPPPPR